MESIYTDIRRTYPPLCLKIKVANQRSTEEQFCLRCSSNTVEIDAASPLAESFALSQLLGGLGSRRLGDIVGESRPLFSFRPLWLQEGRWYCLAGGTCIYLPHWMVPEDGHDALFIDQLSLHIKSVIELGFNAFVFAGTGDPVDPKPLSWHILRPCLDMIRTSGLKIALRAVPQEEKVDLKQFLRNLGIFRASLDYFVCQQNDLFNRGFQSPTKDPTPFEKACIELRLLESMLILPVIYNLDPGFTAPLPLSHEVSKQSIIAFRAICDEALDPVFSDVSRANVEDETRLLPLVEIFQLDLGQDCFFSDLPLEQIENVLGRQKNGRFCGAGCLARKLSILRHFSQSSLWVMGQRMWRHLNVQALFESWLDRFHPNCREWFQQALQNELHTLFCAQNLGQIEEAAHTLVQIGQKLAAIKEAQRFKKSSTSTLELASLLYQFQVAMKASLEKQCRDRAAKVPLSLQNYVPTEIISSQKI